MMSTSSRKKAFDGSDGVLEEGDFVTDDEKYEELDEDTSLDVTWVSKSNTIKVRK